MGGGLGARGSVITGVITAPATLLGVWLTQRHARKMRLLDQHDERCMEQREALVQVLATGREYVTSAEAVMLRASAPQVGHDRPSGLRRLAGRLQR